jgi:hypothetical protein
VLQCKNACLDDKIHPEMPDFQSIVLIYGMPDTDDSKYVILNKKMTSIEGRFGQAKAE